MTELRIIRIEAADGQIAKGGHNGKQFIAPITYVLENGKRVPSKIIRRLKRDVVAELASYPRDVNNMTAHLDANGNLSSISTVLNLR